MTFIADTMFDITAETDETSVPLLPTPVGADSHRTGVYAGGNPTLGEAVKLLPTPTTADTRPSRTPEQIAIARRAGGCSNLRETVINEITNEGAS